MSSFRQKQLESACVGNYTVLSDGTPLVGDTPGKKQLEDGSGSPPLNQALVQPGQHVWAEPELKQKYLDFSCTLSHPMFKQESQDKVYFTWIVANAQQEATSNGL